MLGAIIGDIVGSRFEFNNHRSKEFSLFADGCFATDDSIMTLAAAKAIMEASKVCGQSQGGFDRDFYAVLSELTVKYMQEIGRKYPTCGFGGMFYQWVFSDAPQPYNSFGNGAAMRVSPAGFAAADEREAEQLAEAVTEVTHNHDEGIKGAKAVAVAIAMARRGALKSEIRSCIRNEYYPLDFRIDDIRPTYRVNETCQETVPQAIECFLESNCFEDAIRTAISLGGDSDTIAAITGAIAEAYYGVPDEIKENALTYLDEDLRAIYAAWEKFAPPSGERFRFLTKYIGKIGAIESFGKWISDKENDGTPEHPMQAPYIRYCDLVGDIITEVHLFAKEHPEYNLTNYRDILKKNGLEWGASEMRRAKIQSLDAGCILAMIMGAVRAERFCDGALLGLLQDGSISAWLMRLGDIDWHNRNITEVSLELGGYGGSTVYYAFLSDECIRFKLNISNYGDTEEVEITDPQRIAEIRSNLCIIHFEYWDPHYPQQGDPRICDGEQWELCVKYSDGMVLKSDGDNAYPPNWNVLLEFFGLDDEDEEDQPQKRKPGELIYCSVSFDGGKTYYYTTEDETIEVGDEVIVPVGDGGHELHGEVEEIEYFLPEDVPFPLERTKAIIGKADGTHSDNGDYERLDLSSGETTALFAVPGLGNGIGEDSLGNCWCPIDVIIKTHYFNYRKIRDEMLEFGELIELRDRLGDLLADKLTEPEHLTFLEPDLEFLLYPKFDLRTAEDVVYVREGCEIQDIYIMMIIHLSDNTCGYNGQTFAIPFDRSETEALKKYLDAQIPQLETQWQESLKNQGKARTKT